MKSLCPCLDTRLSLLGKIPFKKQGSYNLANAVGTKSDTQFPIEVCACACGACDCGNNALAYEKTLSAEVCGGACACACDCDSSSRYSQFLSPLLTFNSSNLIEQRNSYYLSRYAKMKNFPEGIVLYNPLFLRPILGERYLLDVWEGLQSPIVTSETLCEIDKSFSCNLTNDLIDCGILIPRDREEFNPASFVPDSYLNVIYLLLSGECNLECKYCAVETAAQNSRKNNMSTDIIDNVLDFIANNTRDKNNPITIIFYGGEPLKNRSVLKYAIKRIRFLESVNLLPKVNLSIITNGTLIDEKIAYLFVEENVRVSVSIDGPPEYHNSGRVLSGQRGSFRRAIHGFEILQKCGLNPQISSTISAYNVHNLLEICQFFVQKMNISSMGFNFVKNVPFGSEYRVTSQISSEQILCAFEYLRSEGIYEDRVMRKIKAIINQSPHFADCAAYGNQIAVDWNGQVGPCHILLSHGTEVWGNIRDTDLLDRISQGMKKWALRTPYHMPICYECDAIGVCGGGCVADVLANGGDFYDLDHDACIHAHTTLDWAFREILKRSLHHSKYNSQ